MLIDHFSSLWMCLDERVLKCMLVVSHGVVIEYFIGQPYQSYNQDHQPYLKILRSDQY